MRRRVLVLDAGLSVSLFFDPGTRVSYRFAGIRVPDQLRANFTRLPEEKDPRSLRPHNQISIFSTVFLDYSI